MVNKNKAVDFVVVVVFFVGVIVVTLLVVTGQINWLWSINVKLS